MRNFEPFWSVYFGFGVLVVWSYAWKRFNEPTFPNRANLPHTVEPLRYLFLGPAYAHARWYYVGASLILYVFLVAPGPSIIEVAGMGETVPATGWALFVALFIVGFVPNSRLRWLEGLEEGLRGLVHRWFLVPEGIDATIGILEDAAYEAPRSLSDSVAGAAIGKLRDAVRSRANTLEQRWARAQILMISLNEMGPDSPVPLKRAAFEPFQEDWDAIKGTYRSLKKELGALGDDIDSSEKAEDAKDAVDRLLEQIYRYISWGIWYQANSEREVGETLRALGFIVPQVAGRHLFDVVVPPACVVAAVTVAFQAIVLYRGHGTGSGSWGWPKIFLSAVIAGAAAASMYGGAVILALRKRSALIERKAWREGSAKSLSGVAVSAGLLTWAVTSVSAVIIYVYLNLPPDSVDRASASIRMLAGITVPVMVFTAMPWMLAGGAVGTCVARGAGRNVRQVLGAVGRRGALLRRVEDGLILAWWLGLTVAVAQAAQTALSTLVWAAPTPDPYDEAIAAFTIGVVGALCGAIIGYSVPHSCRENLVTPSEPEVARALEKLIEGARTKFGGQEKAEAWVFSPQPALDGLTPAEAVRYQGYASGVMRLL